MTVIDLSVTADNEVAGTADELLQSVYDDLEVLIDEYMSLNEIADDEQHPEIANYAQDQLRLLRRSCWQLRSILDDYQDEEETDEEDDQ
jgi:DNA-binding ferritin-like protein